MACTVLLATGAASEVLELNDGNFQNTVDDAEFSAVLFHAPWSASSRHQQRDFDSFSSPPAGVILATPFSLRSSLLQPLSWGQRTSPWLH